MWRTPSVWVIVLGGGRTTRRGGGGCWLGGGGFKWGGGSFCLRGAEGRDPHFCGGSGLVLALWLNSTEDRPMCLWMSLVVRSGSSSALASRRVAFCTWRCLAFAAPPLRLRSAFAASPLPLLLRPAASLQLRSGSAPALLRLPPCFLRRFLGLVSVRLVDASLSRLANRPHGSGAGFAWRLSECQGPEGGLLFRGPGASNNKCRGGQTTSARVGGVAVRCCSTTSGWCCLGKGRGSNRVQNVLDSEEKTLDMRLALLQGSKRKKVLGLLISPCPGRRIFTAESRLADNSCAHGYAATYSSSKLCVAQKCACLQHSYFSRGQRMTCSDSAVGLLSRFSSK